MSDVDPPSAKSNSSPARYDAASSAPNSSGARAETPAGKSEPPRTRAEAKADKPRTPDATAPALVAITMDARTAQVVKLEALDATGARHELSEDEKAKLVTEGSEDLEEVVEQAFEAGIACILDGGNGSDGATEDAKDAELRHLLLTPLIAGSSAKHLMERAVLDRAILGTLIEHSMASRSGAAAGNPPAGMS